MNKKTKNTPNTKTLIPGTNLRNGGIVIKASDTHVLAIFRPTSPEPYVVWSRDVVNPDEMHTGRYFKELIDAESCFTEKTKLAERKAKDNSQHTITVIVEHGIISDIQDIPGDVVVKVVDLDTQAQPPAEEQEFPFGMQTMV